MRRWHHQRSAPLGALLAGSLVLGATGVVATVFYVSVVRAARGLPAYTAGIPAGKLATPAAARAVYDGRLRSAFPRHTPAGTPSAAHRWRVVAPAAPDDALCRGEAYDGVEVYDAWGARGVAVPLPAELFVARPSQPVPARLMALCPDASLTLRPDALEYQEDVLPPELPVQVVACRRGDERRGVLAPCEDGAPSRVYFRAPDAMAREQLRGALARIAVCAVAFALVCFGGALLALRAFDRRRVTAS